MTTVSIALATYNRSRFLDQQLRTLALQERLADELVVSVDASTDGTVAKIEAFAATAPFPGRLRRNVERLEYRANFIRAVRLCRSNVIAFCDRDDIWEPRKLHACLAPFDDPEVLIVYQGALALAPDGTPLAPFEQLTAPAVANYPPSLPIDFILGFTQLFRSSPRSRSQLSCQSLDHKEAHRRDRMAHDKWFRFLGSVLRSIAHTDDRLVRFHQRESNTFGWKAPSRLARIAQCLWPSLNGRAERYAALEMGAGRRADILGQRAFTARANAGAEKYCALARLFGERQGGYGSANFRDRAGAFCRLQMSYGYRTKCDWGLGARAFLTDLCLELPVGYRLSAARARLIPRRSSA